MSRKKRSSRILEKAQLRSDGIQSVDYQLDAGGGFTALGYLQTIGELRSEMSNYNTALSNIDSLNSRVADIEERLAEYSERMLLGVAAKYGKDSREYEMAGGVRKRDRKRPTRRVAVATS